MTYEEQVIEILLEFRRKMNEQRIDSRGFKSVYNWKRCPLPRKESFIVRDALFPTINAQGEIHQIGMLRGLAEEVEDFASAPDLHEDLVHKIYPLVFKGYISAGTLAELVSGCLKMIKTIET